MKQKRVNRLALAAMLAALSVVFLYLTSVLPTGGLALSALAGILASVTCLECGFFWAAAHYAVCCALDLLLAPEKTYVLWYVFALGLYGILKLPIEGVKQKALQWILKLAVLAACLALLQLVYRAAFAAALPKWSSPALYLVLAAVFVVYDIGVTGVLRQYRRRVRRQIS